MSEHIQHPVYKNINQKEGETEGWAFLNAKDFKKINFSMPDLGETEVRGKILYSGLCHSDVLTGRALWGDVLYPLSAGHEGVAEVIEVGSKVDKLKKGDIFLVGCFRNNCGSCHQCSDTYDNLCTGLEPAQKYTYGLYYGTYSSHIQLEQNWAIKAPEGLDLPNAAPLMCAGITTYAPIARYGKKGRKCAVLGVGGLGHMAVQYASKLGMEVTAFVSDLKSEEFVKGLGATHVVNWVSGDLEALKGSFQLLVNTLPIMPTPQQLEALVSTLEPNGDFVQLGVPNQAALFSVAPAAFVTSNISIHGSLVGSKKETEEMLEFSLKHGVKVLCEHFKFDEFDKALDKLENGKPIFRCVVDFCHNK